MFFLRVFKNSFAYANEFQKSLKKGCLIQKNINMKKYQKITPYFIFINHIQFITNFKNIVDGKNDPG